jgi:hypothetical protein
MIFNIYVCKFKGETFIKITSDVFINKKLDNNSRELNSLERDLIADSPKDFNVYKADVYNPKVSLSDFYESLSYEDTIKIDVSIFNEAIKMLKFKKIIFMNAIINLDNLLKLDYVQQISINGSSKGIIDFFNLKNLNKINILRWNNKIILKNKSSSLKHLIVWYYNPKSKSFFELLNELDSVEYLEINLTNIETLEGISQLKNLKELKINYGRNLKFVSNLNLINGLELVCFNNCKKIDDLSLLKNKEGLTIKNLNLPG